MDISLLCDFDYFTAERQIDKIRERYPFAGRRLLGKSVMGKRIEALLLGSAEEYSVFIGSAQGRDHFSSAVLLTFFEELCFALSTGGNIEGLNVARALSGRAVAVIPFLNPDGCEIASKGRSACPDFLAKKIIGEGKSFSDFSLNAREVDIDLNFTSRRAKSEPETFALSEFFKNNGARQTVILGSGQGEIISPIGEKLPARSSRMTEIMVASTGYTVISNKNDRRREGFLDWFSAEYFKPAYKILPQIPTAKMKEADYLVKYKELRELLMLCAIM